MKKIFILATVVILLIGGWMFFIRHNTAKNGEKSSQNLPTAVSSSSSQHQISGLPSVVRQAKEGFKFHPSSSNLLRIIEPVRLSTQKGTALDGEIAQTKQILEKFEKSGYNCALWAVDVFPAKNEDMKSWAESCLKAFPGGVMIALDAKLENGVLSLEKPKLKLFLKTVCSASQVSILLNYTRLDNFHCPENSEEAIKAVANTARVVKEVSPKTFCWLLLDDHPAAAGKIAAWTKGLDKLADGYYLNRSHGLKALSDLSFADAAATLTASGKPVIRGGFTYTAPRERPGIEQDLREQYNDRISRYENWIVQTGCAGYARTIGESAPEKMNINLVYVPGR